ncbi:MAG: type 2 isopentenyl-diphosphate Delta-isomerase [Saprospiraceae bacterium]|nr:type 2 isopentenyl-diphosphate Delta-isomerase [Saprospiraceae bacterium]
MINSKAVEEPTIPIPDDDPTAAERKRDHIELAFRSQIERGELDRRFYYEPLLSAHPQRGSLKNFLFLGKTMRVPMWVSSMTGGTEWAYTINHNLARACKDFGMGMGLGSCRVLLTSDETLPDFDVRSDIGDELPLYANLGIAQIEQIVERGRYFLVKDLLKKLQADGLIIHVNPLQEWLQPEGDRFAKAPIETIARFLERMDISVIVKEVGQGMGYESLKALFQLPLAAIDFAANGGTNFAKLELLRSDQTKQEIYSQLANVGHSAEEMVTFTNQIASELGEKMLCKQVIISGGIKHFLDGYYLVNKANANAVYGQASGFLKHARGAYEELYDYVDAQVQGLELANAFLKIR